MPRRGQAVAKATAQAKAGMEMKTMAEERAGSGIVDRVYRNPRQLQATPGHARTLGVSCRGRFHSISSDDFHALGLWEESESCEVGKGERQAGVHQPAGIWLETGSQRSKEAWTCTARLKSWCS